ncbi:MAG: hypothetical protein R2827_12735 [Bdellovibrionales bacterium]
MKKREIYEENCCGSNMADYDKETEIPVWDKRSLTFEEDRWFTCSGGCRLPKDQFTKLV